MRLHAEAAFLGERLADSNRLSVGGCQARCAAWLERRARFGSTSEFDTATFLSVSRQFGDSKFSSVTVGRHFSST